MSEPDSFDPELRDLLRGETDDTVFTDEATARILERLETSIPALAPEPGGPPQPPSTTPHLLATKMGIAVASAILGGLVGAGAVRAFGTGAPPQIVYVDRIVTVSSPPAIASPVPSPSVSASAPSISASAIAAPSSRVDENSVQAERRLLDEARTAYARGDGEVALATLSKHAARYPAGALVEEREALAIRVLVDLGRHAEGRTRGQRFRAKFPKSLMLPAVEAALESIP